MKKDIIATVRDLNAKELEDLRGIVIKEAERRAQIADLVYEINEKLYRLSGLLTGSDSLRVLNNLTGEIMTDMIDWDEPEDDKRYLAPELNVEFAAIEHNRLAHCPGAPVNCHECDDCPWD